MRIGRINTVKCSHNWIVTSVFHHSWNLGLSSKTSVIKISKRFVQQDKRNIRNSIGKQSMLPLTNVPRFALSNIWETSRNHYIIIISTTMIFKIYSHHQEMCCGKTSVLINLNTIIRNFSRSNTCKAEAKQGNQNTNHDFY